MANPTFRVSSGLIERKHRMNIGGAIWIYLWCLDKQTGSHGKVLGGKPVTYEEIATQAGESRRQAIRHIRTLEEYGYIETVQTPQGISIRVLEQKKFTHGGGDKNVTSRGDNSDTPRGDRKGTNTKNVTPPGVTRMATRGDKDGYSNIRHLKLTPEVDPLRRAAAATQKPDPEKGRERPEDHDVPKARKRQAVGLRNVTALERLRADKETRLRGELTVGSHPPPVGWMDVAAAAVKPMGPPAAKTPHGLSGKSRGKLRDRLMELIRKHWPETPAKKIKGMVRACQDKDLMITVAELEKNCPQPEGAA